MRDGVAAPAIPYAAAVERLAHVPHPRDRRARAGATTSANPEGATIADVRSGRCRSRSSPRARSTRSASTRSPRCSRRSRSIRLRPSAACSPPAIADTGAAGARRARRRRRRGAARPAPASARPHAAASAAGGLRRGADRRAPLGARAARLRAARRADGHAHRRRLTSPASTASSPTCRASRRPRRTSARRRWPPTSRCGRACSSLVANPKAWERARPARRDAPARGRRARRCRRRSHQLRRAATPRPTPCSAGAARVSLARATAADADALRAALAPVSRGLDPARSRTDRPAARTRPGRRPPTRRAARRPRAQTGTRRRPSTAPGSFDSDAADLRAAPRAPARPHARELGPLRVRVLARAVRDHPGGTASRARGSTARTRVRGHRMTWDVTDGGGYGPQDATNRPGEHFDFTWSRFKDTLAARARPRRGSPRTTSSRSPWRRIGDDAAPGAVVPPLPAAAERRFSSEASAGRRAPPGRGGAGRATRAARAS